MTARCIVRVTSVLQPVKDALAQIAHEVLLSDNGWYVRKTESTPMTMCSQSMPAPESIFVHTNRQYSRRGWEAGLLVCCQKRFASPALRQLRFVPDRFCKSAQGQRHLDQATMDHSAHSSEYMRQTRRVVFSGLHKDRHQYPKQQQGQCRATRHRSTAMNNLYGALTRWAWWCQAVFQLMAVVGEVLSH